MDWSPGLTRPQKVKNIRSTLTLETPNPGSLFFTPNQNSKIFWSHLLNNRSTFSAAGGWSLPSVEIISARSVSRVIWERIHNLPEYARLLGCFDRSMDFLVGEDVIALVSPEIGDGPFHIVVDRIPKRPLIEILPVWGEENILHIGCWSLCFPSPPAIWEPCLQWEEIRISEEAICIMRQVVEKEARARIDHSHFSATVLGRSVSFLSELGDALASGDCAKVMENAARIAGFGSGLTPAGDDFLSGVMLAVYVHPSIHKSNKSTLCQWIYSATMSRTTRLSDAYLKAANNGMADIHWHNLAHSLQVGEMARIKIEASAALKFGETSGLDMANGFLWLFETIKMSSE